MRASMSAGWSPTGTRAMPGRSTSCCAGGLGGEGWGWGAAEGRRGGGKARSEESERGAWGDGGEWGGGAHRHGEDVGGADLEADLLLGDALVRARHAVRLSLRAAGAARHPTSAAGERACGPGEVGYAAAACRLWDAGRPLAWISVRMCSKSVKISPGRWRNSPHSTGRPGWAGVYTSCRTSGRRVQISVPRGRKSLPTWRRGGGAVPASKRTTGVLSPKRKGTLARSATFRTEHIRAEATT